MGSGDDDDAAVAGLGGSGNPGTPDAKSEYYTYSYLSIIYFSLNFTFHVSQPIAFLTSCP